MVVLEDKAGNFTTSSFVQIRGSIPLLWSQIPNIKYKPPTRIAPPSDYHAPFDRHFKDLLDIYQARALLHCFCCTLCLQSCLLCMHLGSFELYWVTAASAVPCTKERSQAC